MHNKRILPALALACAALLAGCASTGEPLSAIPVGAYREALELSGRLSVNYDKGGQNETLAGKFNWTQTPAALDIKLISPLGQTIATIRVTPQAATLTQSGRAPRVATDIDSLTAQTLGWTLPVSGLRDWLQGYATAADGRRFIASPANNSVTTPDGWRLSYVGWQGGPVPQVKRLDAQRDASAAGSAVALRIVIDEPN